MSARWVDCLRARLLHAATRRRAANGAAGPAAGEIERLRRALDEANARAHVAASELAAARAAAASAERDIGALRAALDEHSIISVTDRSGRIVEVNSGFCQISGYSREELIGQDHRIINSGTHPRSFWVHVWRTIGAGKAWRGVVCNRRKDGTIYWVDSTIVPHLDDDGRVARYVSIRFDVTAQKLGEIALEAQTAKANALAAQAEAANVAKSAFLANMSHEIRTPMTAILGFTELLLDPLLEPAVRDEYTRTVQRNGEHLLAIINDVLDLSKVESGRMTVERCAVDTAELLEDVRALMSVRAEAKRLALEVVCETEVPRVITTDPIRLRQILVNLVGNAVKFTDAGGVTLRVAYLPDRRLLRIAVADTGIGIPAEALGRIFLPFVQVDDSTTRRYGGTGLGLDISKRLASMLGGDIQAESVPGRGSVFTVTVAAEDIGDGAMLDSAALRGAPIGAAPEPDPASATAAEAPLRGVRVHVVENSPDNRRLIAFYLRKAGAEVRLYDDGSLVLDALIGAGATGSRASPAREVLLSEMQLPGLDGYQLVQALRTAGWGGRIVALTAAAMAGDAERCVEAGCDGYVAKPIDRALLLRMCGADASSAQPCA